MFQKVTPSFFKKTIARAGISKQLHAHAGLGIVKEILAERFGEGVHLHAKPIYIKYRVLTMMIAHPAVGEQIRIEEEAIVREINKRIGRNVVIRIQFSLQKEEQKEITLPPHQE